jgi:hypothetical protein
VRQVACKTAQLYLEQQGPEQGPRDKESA